MEETKLRPSFYILRSIVKWIGRHRLISLAVFLALAGALYGVNQRNKTTSGTLTEPVRKGDIVESVYGIGTVVANRSFKVKPGVNNTLTDVFVKEGDKVVKGQRLVNMDGVLIRAPFAGTITSLPYKVGENVFSTQPILTLVDLLDRYLVVSLEQQGALRVKPGQAARISFDSIRETSYAGLVESIYSNENSFLARIETQNLPPNILPGMTADVAITVASSKDVLLAPVAALEQGKYVWIKRGRKPVAREEVVVGVVDGALVEIREGMREGDRALIRKRVSH